MDLYCWGSQSMQIYQHTEITKMNETITTGDFALQSIGGYISE